MIIKYMLKLDTMNTDKFLATSQNLTKYLDIKIIENLYFCLGQQYRVYLYHNCDIIKFK